MPQAHRDHALDRAKGLAIFAVVLFHVTRGFVTAGLLPQTPGLRFADTLAYGWHVQTFLVIAGYLAFPRAALGRFQLRRQASLYYTYLLWSLITWLLLVPFASKVNTPLTWQDLFWIPVVPIQHFWFLLVLMAGTALLGLLRSGPLLLASAVLLLAIGHPSVFDDLGPANYSLQIYFHGVPFVLIGGWLSQSGLRVVPAPWAALICAAALALAAWGANHKGAELGPMDVPFMLAGGYAVYVAAHYSARIPRLAAALDLLGRHSLAIYILHVIAGAGLRIILVKLAPGLNTGIAMLLSLGAAVIGPIVAELIARRLGLAVLLGLDPLPFWSEPRKVATA
ncbi:acyltransferase family protein [Sphingobium nicotianae]|nr:acyltransferase [Sphingobium nicotianae]